MDFRSRPRREAEISTMRQRMYGEPDRAPRATAPPAAPPVPPVVSPAPQPPVDNIEQPIQTPHVATTQSVPSRSHGYRRLAFEACLVVALLALGIVTWQTSKAKSDLEGKLAESKSQTVAAAESRRENATAYVGVLAGLLVGETPAMATVNDAEQAKKDSAFFKDAQNGDQLLTYPKAGRAILYRPATDKIIIVAPYTASAAPAAGTATR